jgi:hypothetical protein
MQTNLKQDAPRPEALLEQCRRALSSGAMTARAALGAALQSPQPMVPGCLDDPGKSLDRRAVEDGVEPNRYSFPERDGIAPFRGAAFRLGTGGLSLPVCGEGR